MTEQVKNILDWISPLDFSVQQKLAFIMHQKGTGLWFLGSPEFNIGYRAQKSLVLPRHSRSWQDSNELNRDRLSKHQI